MGMRKHCDRMSRWSPVGSLRALVHAVTAPGDTSARAARSPRRRQHMPSRRWSCRLRHRVAALGPASAGAATAIPRSFVSSAAGRGSASAQAVHRQAPGLPPRSGGADGQAHRKRWQIGTRMHVARADTWASDGNRSPDSHALTTATETPRSKAMPFCGTLSLRRQRRRFIPSSRELSDRLLTFSIPPGRKVTAQAQGGRHEFSRSDPAPRRKAACTPFFGWPRVPP